MRTLATWQALSVGHPVLFSNLSVHKQGPKQVARNSKVADVRRLDGLNREIASLHLTLNAIPPKRRDFIFFYIVNSAAKLSLDTTDSKLNLD